MRIVFELMATQPATESIGVVALSRPQADLIQELIDLRRLSDRRFDARFAEDAQECFFVKNLESVQGDERDHIILSIGYGPTTASGAVPNRFGPVNIEGGHRRLNVAVSRVREAVLTGMREALRQARVTWLPRQVSNGQGKDFLVTSLDQAFEPRGPLQDGTARDIDHLCDQEIQAAVIRIVRAMVGAPKDEVITATARAFGYARTGEHVEARIRKVVDGLLAIHRLVERMGSLVLRD